MGMISQTKTATNDIFAALVLDLETEFGSTETTGLARHFLDAEAADFHWNARQMERHLGAYEGENETGGELEAIRITGFLSGHWFVATCTVDGDGQVHDMPRCKRFTSERQADQAFSGDG
jgi:hypothetical protein